MRPRRRRPRLPAQPAQHRRGRPRHGQLRLPASSASSLPSPTTGWKPNPPLARPTCCAKPKSTTTLAEAVAHCTLVLGTGSLDRRRPVQAILALPEAAAQIREALTAPKTKARTQPRPKPDTPMIALVFGSEKHGLTSEDLSWCHAIIVIETCEAQPSMNLGQAVAVCLYEISRNSPKSVSEIRPTAEAETGQGPASVMNSSSAILVTEQLDRLAALVEETMEAVNYSDPRHALRQRRGPSRPAPPPHAQRRRPAPHDGPLPPHSLAARAARTRQSLRNFLGIFPEILLKFPARPL
jgi:tRNA C32,U32 (ribose-2'-O)-methylase TrmJ